MAGIEFLGQVAERLSALDAPNSLRSRLAPFLFVNKPLVKKLQRFPFQQADPIRVVPGKIKPIRKALTGLIGSGNAPGLPLGDFAPQYFAEKSFFVAEIMVEHPFVNRRPAGDLVHARAGEAFSGEFPKSRFQNSFLGAFRVTPRQPWGGQTRRDDVHKQVSALKIIAAK